MTLNNTTFLNKMSNITNPHTNTTNSNTNTTNSHTNLPTHHTNLPTHHNAPAERRVQMSWLEMHGLVLSPEETLEKLKNQATMLKQIAIKYKRQHNDTKPYKSIGNAFSPKYVCKVRREQLYMKYKINRNGYLRAKSDIEALKRRIACRNTTRSGRKVKQTQFFNPRDFIPGANNAYTIGRKVDSWTRDY